VDAPLGFLRRKTILAVLVFIVKYFVL